MTKPRAKAGPRPPAILLSIGKALAAGEQPDFELYNPDAVARLFARGIIESSRDLWLLNGLTTAIKEAGPEVTILQADPLDFPFRPSQAAFYCRLVAPTWEGMLTIQGLWPYIRFDRQPPSTPPSSP